MYVSIRDDIVAAVGYEDIAEGLAALGLDAVEVAPDREYKARSLHPGEKGAWVDLSSQAERDRLKKLCAESGLRITALLLATDFNAIDLAAEIGWIANNAKIAQDLGVGVIRIDPILHGNSPVPAEKRLDHMVDGLRRMLEATADLPTKFGIENHGHIGNDPDFLAAIFDTIGSDRLGMTFDTGNFYWAGHPLTKVYSSIERLAKHVVHTHVKNIRYPEEMREQQRELGYEYGTYVSPIAQGDIDHEKVVGILRAAGYTGDLCIEDESIGRYDFDTRVKHIKEAVALLSRLA